jgi:hypothetical protein
MVETKISPLKKVALVTTDSSKLPYLELESVAEILKKSGIEIEIVSYFDQEIDWKKYSLINLNGCTNYFQNIEKFRAFCAKISRLKVKTHNPISVILWNLEKNYLLDLEKAGFDVAPTIWVQKNQNLNLESEVKKLGWQKIILKPSLSAGSFNTEVFEINQIEKAQNHLQKITEFSAAMIQQFLPEVVEIGEYSAIFLKKKFSHLVLKTPANGDFRAGIRQGANVKALPESQNFELINHAKKIVNYLEQDLLYARVDMVKSDKIYLMELELIEPLLYSDFAKNFAEKYAKEILSLIQA